MGVIGILIGAVAAKADWLKELVDAFRDTLDDHGLAVALVVVLVPAVLWLVRYLLVEIIKTKNDEIDRLIKERDRFLDQILQKPPSSRAKGGSK